MLIYALTEKEKSQNIIENTYFLSESEVFDFFDCQKEYWKHNYRVLVVDPFEKNEISYYKEKDKVKSRDYLVEYKKFKNNLKHEYSSLALTLFLGAYPRILSEDEIYKLHNLRYDNYRN